MTNVSRVIPVQNRPTVDFGSPKISLTSAWPHPSFLSSWIASHFFAAATVSDDLSPGELLETIKPRTSGQKT